MTSRAVLSLTAKTVHPPTLHPILAVLLYCVALTLCDPAVARPLLVLNPSFESPALSDGTFTIENISGWSVPTNSGNPGVYNPPASAFPTVVDKKQTLYSNGAEVVQTLPVALAPNTVYTLGVFVGRRKDFENFPGFTVRLRAGTTVLAARTAQDVPTPEPGEFVFVTLSYVSPAEVEPDQMLQISLDSDGAQTNFDSVRLDATPFSPTSG